MAITELFTEPTLLSVVLKNTSPLKPLLWHGLVVRFCAENARNIAIASEFITGAKHPKA